MGLGLNIFKHTTIYSMAALLGKLTSFIMLPFYAHIFETVGYGIIAMLDITIGVFSLVFAGNVQTAIMRIYYEQDDDNKKSLVLGTGVWLVWIIGISIVAFPIIYSTNISKFLFGNPDYYLLIRLAILSFIFDVASQSASTILIIKQKSSLFSLIELIRLVINLSLNIFFVVIIQIGLTGIFISSLITAFLGCFILHILLIKQYKLRFDRQLANSLFKYQLPLLPGEIISFCGRQMERVMVRLLIGLEGMGVLEMGYKFPPLLNIFITNPFHRAWRAKSIELAEQVNGAFIISKMFTRYFFFMVFLGLILSVTIQNILELLTPNSFWQAGRIAQIEILTTILAGCTTYISFGILYRKQTYIISVVRIILTPTKIFMGFILISTWGLQGAAYSALIIEIATLIWITIKAQKLYKLPFEYYKIAIIITSAFILFLSLNIFNYFEFGFTAYMREFWFSPIINFLQTTQLGMWESGQFLLTIQSKQNQIISLFLNTVFSMTFLVLLPLIWYEPALPYDQTPATQV